MASQQQPVLIVHHSHFYLNKINKLKFMYVETIWKRNHRKVIGRGKGNFGLVLGGRLVTRYKIGNQDSCRPPVGSSQACVRTRA